MSKAGYPLKLSASIEVAAARFARENGVSLNQWFATAVAQKIGVVETAALRRRLADLVPRRSLSSVTTGLREQKSGRPSSRPVPWA